MPRAESVRTRSRKKNDRSNWGLPRRNAMVSLEQIRKITTEDLLSLGVKDVAYLKDIEVDGGSVVGIFAANGQQLALLPDRNAAIAAAVENGLAPVTLH